VVFSKQHAGNDYITMLQYLLVHTGINILFRQNSPDVFMRNS